jgi:hypothetical protein
MKDLIVGLNMPKLKNRNMEEPDLIQKLRLLIYLVFEKRTWIGLMLQWAGLDWTD